MGSITTGAIQIFKDVASVRAAAPKLAGTTIEFHGGILGNEASGVVGDIVAMAGSTGPVLGDSLSVVGPIAGVEKLFGAGASRFSGYDGSLQGVVQLLGDQPVLTNAKVLLAEGAL